MHIKKTWRHYKSNTCDINSSTVKDFEKYSFYSRPNLQPQAIYHQFNHCVFHKKKLNLVDFIELFLKILLSSVSRVRMSNLLKRPCDKFKHRRQRKAPFSKLLKAVRRI